MKSKDVLLVIVVVALARRWGQRSSSTSSAPSGPWPPGEDNLGTSPNPLPAPLR